MNVSQNGSRRTEIVPVVAGHRRDLDEGSSARIFTNSLLLCEQIRGRYKVKNRRLKQLVARFWRIIGERNLAITIHWVPREENPAGRKLEKACMEHARRVERFRLV